MIHPLRKLAREIHRRSVWQVLAGYLLLAWVALKLVSRLTIELGLPLWTPAMALTLLAIGLPVVIATAVVQGGLPGLRMIDLVDPNELEGLTPEQVLVIPEDHPLYGLGLFTWRNAILGALMGAALLVTSVVSYLAMWALGIGPVGSLIAQGILADHDTVFVAAFENRTDNAGIAASVTEALHEELGHSSVVTVLDTVAVGSALGRMGLESQPWVPASAAIDFAAREGVRAIVRGAVTRERGAYRVVARITLGDGTALAMFEESVPDDDSVPDEAAIEGAVMVLATKLRTKLGEPLRVINAERAARHEGMTTRPDMR